MNSVPIKTSFAIRLTGLTDHLTGQKISDAIVTLTIRVRENTIYTGSFTAQGEGNYIINIPPLDQPPSTKCSIFIEAVKQENNQTFKLTIRKESIFSYLE